MLKSFNKFTSSFSVKPSHAVCNHLFEQAGFPNVAQLFPECATKGSRFTLSGSGGWMGLGRVRSTLCFSVRNLPQPSAQPLATVHNRSQPFANVVSTTVAGTLWPCQWGVLQKWSHFYGGSKRRVASFRVARVALRMHFVTFQHVSSYVKSHSVWQAFCIVFRRWRSCFVAGAALWTCPSSFCVAGAALYTCGVACFLRIALSGLHITRWLNANCVASVAFWHVWQWWILMESSHEKSILRLQILGFVRATQEYVGFVATKCQNLRLSRMHFLFGVSNVSPLDSLVLLWLRRAYGENCKTFHFHTPKNWPGGVGASDVVISGIKSGLYKTKNIAFEPDLSGLQNPNTQPHFRWDLGHPALLQNRNHWNPLAIYRH